MFKTQTTRRLIIAVVSIIFCAQGCNRSYYRRQANVEARRLVQQKATDPRWDWANGSIDIDPQSRMFDPFSQDHPPIPPDDPTSHQLMHQVDCKDGYPQWHANGDTNFVENPEWRTYLPINEKGQVVLDIDTAVRLALINSPDFQRQKETLYLSALDVSLQRFGFDSQLFAGFNSFLTTQGRLRNASRIVNTDTGETIGFQGNSSTTLTQSLGSNGQGITLEKMGITGANFVVGLANSIMWNFAGPDTQSATTLIDFSLIQPLLRNAGRDVVMESLTQAERTLLANVRQMDRFRRGFYLDVVIGRNAGAGPNLQGNFLGLPFSAATNAGGYIGLLQEQQRIRIQEFNVAQLEGELNKFREFFLRERVDSLQLRQFEADVLEAQQQLFTLTTAYQNSLDSYKATLGIPPDIEIVISDPTLDQFELISDELTRRQNDLNILKDTAGQVLIDIGALIPGEGDEWPEELDREILAIGKGLDEALRLLALVQDRDVEEVKLDFEKLDEVRPRRVEYLKELKNQVESGEIVLDVEPVILDPDTVRSTDELRPRLAKAVENLQKHAEAFNKLRSIINSFENTREQMGDTEALKEYIRTEILETIPEELTEFRNTLLEVSLLQAVARGNSVEIPEVDLDSTLAIEIARCFRRDWMNARASLVDEWRQIEVVADQLEAGFDLVLEGDVGNFGNVDPRSPNNPFKLRYETGQLRGGFRFDAPIVRLAERNAYRETLIRYQQTKRTFYQFEDEIYRNLRQTLRNIELRKILYELNRKSIQIAIEEVELARFSLEEPARPGADRSLVGPTTARDLLSAINGLQRAQTDFLNTWVSYEVLRRSLDFDLGTMQLDEMGIWIDPGAIDKTIAERAAVMMGISLDGQFCCNIQPFQGDIGELTFDENLQNEVPDSPSLQSDDEGDQDDSYYLRPVRPDVEPNRTHQNRPADIEPLPDAPDLDPPGVSMKKLLSEQTASAQVQSPDSKNRHAVETVSFVEHESGKDNAKYEASIDLFGNLKDGGLLFQALPKLDSPAFGETPPKAGGLTSDSSISANKGRLSRVFDNPIEPSQSGLTPKSADPQTPPSQPRKPLFIGPLDQLLNASKDAGS